LAAAAEAADSDNRILDSVSLELVREMAVAEVRGSRAVLAREGLVVLARAVASAAPRPVRLRRHLSELEVVVSEVRILRAVGWSVSLHRMKIPR